jgi:hypothetical protein
MTSPVKIVEWNETKMANLPFGFGTNKTERTKTCCEASEASEATSVFNEKKEKNNASKTEEKLRLNPCWLEQRDFFFVDWFKNNVSVDKTEIWPLYETLKSNYEVKISFFESYKMYCENKRKMHWLVSKKQFQYHFFKQLSYQFSSPHEVFSKFRKKNVYYIKGLRLKSESFEEKISFFPEKDYAKLLKTLKKTLAMQQDWCKETEKTIRILENTMNQI